MFFLNVKVLFKIINLITTSGTTKEYIILHSILQEIYEKNMADRIISLG